LENGANEYHSWGGTVDEIAFVEPAVVALGIAIRAIEVYFTKTVQINAESSELAWAKVNTEVGKIIKIIVDSFDGASYTTLTENFTAAGELNGIYRFKIKVTIDSEISTTKELSVVIAKESPVYDGDGTTPPPPGDDEDSDKSKIWLLVGIVGGVGALACVAVAGFLFLQKKRGRLD